MPVVLILLLTFPFSIYASELPPQAQKAEKLFEIGDYENSFSLYDECYTESHNPLCISQPLSFLENTFSSLPKLSNNSITTFNPEKKNISTKDFLKNEVKKRLNDFSITDIVVTSLGMPFGISLVPTPGKALDLLDDYRRFYHFIVGENLSGQPIKISTPEEMAKITSEMPLFNSWIGKLNNIANTCYTQDDQEICLGYMKRIVALRKNLDIYYRNFFSYDIVSPILAKSQQLIFDADKSKLFGVDENVMREAAKVLGTLNDDIIKYVYQDVRNQFLDVVKEFREKAGKEFMEELKDIQTLQDKFVNNRYSEPIF